jgi:hypothetical protein
VIENAKVSVLLSTDHDIAVNRAWWCPDFNERIETNQVILTYGPAPCEGRFRLTAHAPASK